MLAFANGDLDNYWAQSGTTEFIVKIMRLYNTDVTELDNIEVDAFAFNIPTEGMPTALPMLYQSGYLSVKRYDPKSQLYTLGFPNNEVRVCLVDCILSTSIDGNIWNKVRSTMWKMYTAMNKGDADQMLLLLQAYLASIPYDLYTKEELEDKVKFEKHFQFLLFLLISFMNVYTHSEVKTATGRVDMVIKCPKHIYVMELKLDGSAEQALAQIDTNHYTLPYKADRKKIIKVGINFSKETRTLGEWIVKTN